MNKSSLLRCAAIAIALASGTAHAQVTIYGMLSNFDVVNDTGSETKGLEIEFHGASNIYSYYNANRYGMPTVVPFNGGLYVRWMAKYDQKTGAWTAGTPNAIDLTPMTGHQCIMGSIGYETSGCEHFGISVTGNAVTAIYRWMVVDPAAPGQLKTLNNVVGIPAPVWDVQPPPQPGQAPVVVADVAPVVPPPPAKRYGPAQWMKTYKTENVRQVLLDELVADNPVVPQDPAELETAWDLIQTDIGDVSNGKHKQKRGSLGGGNHAVVRRFEMYKYTGAVDPNTGQALCSDGLCNAPADGELGDFIGAQNAALDLNGPDFYPVTVTTAGDVIVTSPTGNIKCPGVCSTSVAPGTSVTLTAKVGKGAFAGWTGSCAGNSLTCTLNVLSDAPVTATVKPTYKLVMKTNGTGSVSSNPSASAYMEGTAVTVTAVPGAGATWKGWTGGGCSGLGLTCTVTMTADTTVTANFR